jgi:hypothetical protein
VSLRPEEHSPRAARLIETVLRCYPDRWRRRHGEEAAELAALLIRDGTPARSIAWNYFAGAAREWLTPPPGRRVRTAACALLAIACSLGISAGLLASTAPARAASTSQARGHSPCRPGSPGPALSVIPAMSHPQAIFWAASHDRSC